MAKRNFNDQIWLDADFSEYTAEEMLVYLYTYYNPRQTLAGVYIWTLKQAACDLPIDKTVIKQAMNKFFAKGIFLYDESTHELMVTDWCKHMLNPSPKTYGAVVPVLPQIKSDTIRQKVENEVDYWDQVHLQNMVKKGEKEALKKNIEAHSAAEADRIMGTAKDRNASEDMALAQEMPEVVPEQTESFTENRYEPDYIDVDYEASGDLKELLDDSDGWD